MDFQTRPLLRGSDPLVVIATPCYGGMVTQNYMISVLRLMEYCATASFRATAALLGNDSLISRSRSTLLSVFLDHGEATHLLFIDADIAFEPQQIARMMAFDRDFVAALYPVKLLDWARLPPNHEIDGGNPAEPLMHYVGTLCEAPDLEIENGFATALYAGGGFQLIKRAALERMIAAYPETKYNSIHAGRFDTRNGNAASVAINASPNQYALFNCVIEPDTGVYLSEDYSFCWRWRQLGGQIWVDLESKLLHVGDYHFAGDTTERFRDLAGLIPPVPSCPNPL